MFLALYNYFWCRHLW